MSLITFTTNGSLAAVDATVEDIGVSIRFGGLEDSIKQAVSAFVNIKIYPFNFLLL
jgi:hypothetical protein